MISKNDGGLGGLTSSTEEKLFLATESLDFKCNKCGYCLEKVKDKFGLSEKDKKKEKEVPIKIDKQEQKNKVKPIKVDKQEKMGERLGSYKERVYNQSKPLNKPVNKNNQPKDNTTQTDFIEDNTKEKELDLYEFRYTNQIVDELNSFKESKENLNLNNQSKPKTSPNRKPFKTICLHTLEILAWLLIASILVDKGLEILLNQSHILLNRIAFFDDS